MSRATYEIRVEGEVSGRILEDFDRVTVTIEPAFSLVHVVSADESELHGVLNALRREGSVITELRREPDDGPDAAGA